MAEPTPTVPSSPPAAAPSPSPAPAAPVAAASTPPAGDPSPTPTPAATKPEWAPDTFWDKDKNELKGDAIKDMIARDAAETSRKLTLPGAPDKYEPKLPKDFKAPDGVAFEISADDPLWAQAREWAHKNGISQEGFEQGVALIAARDVGTQQTLKAARDAEIAKLGATGTARVSALNTFLDAKGLPALKGMMVTAEIVTSLEKMMAMVNGADTFSQQHRTAQPTNGKIDGYEKMSFEQKRQAQDALAARQPAR